MQILSYKNFNI